MNGVRLSDNATPGEACLKACCDFEGALVESLASLAPRLKHYTLRLAE